MENVAYHGRNISIVWDRDGSHYQQGAGFRIYIDVNLVLVRSAIQPVVIPVPPGPPQTLPFLVNDAVNAWGGPFSPAPYPIASASYTSPYDDAQRAIGQVAFLDIPNTREHSLDRLRVAKSNRLVVGQLRSDPAGERHSDLFL